MKLVFVNRLQNACILSVFVAGAACLLLPKLLSEKSTGLFIEKVRNFTLKDAEHSILKVNNF